MASAMERWKHYVGFKYDIYQKYIPFTSSPRPFILMKIDKKQAFELVTPVVDGEASAEEASAFHRFMDTDTDIRVYYEEELWLKQTIRQKIKYHPAPENLKSKIQEIVRAEAEREAKLLHTEWKTETDKKPSLSRYSRILALAAVLLISAMVYIAGFSGERLVGDDISAITPYDANHYVHKHYVDNSGKLLKPDIVAPVTSSMQAILKEHFRRDFHVPELADVTLAGVVISEFIPGFETPLFEYILDDNDVIYVFAFYIPEMEEHLKRDPEAVANCTRDSDYYISRAGGKDLVTWKWDDFWYIGISEHDGSVLASLLPR